MKSATTGTESGWIVWITVFCVLSTFTLAAPAGVLIALLFNKNNKNGQRTFVP